MTTWNHCRLSVCKFGGILLDYLTLHKFIDSSKLFFYNPRHRLLLRHCSSIKLALQKFGNLLVYDIAAEHCLEDLNGQVPTLDQWFVGNESLGDALPAPPTLENAALQQFVLAPWHRAQCQTAFLITCSNFGV